MTVLNEKTAFGLSGNQLKLIALVAMTCDHAAMIFFPQSTFLRIVGRLAFPIFAYMIAEGCLYTKNRTRYMGSMAALALVCQLVYFFFMGLLYQCVLVTFSLSIGLIYLLDLAQKEKKVWLWILAVMAYIGVFFLCEILPGLLPGTDFYIDYGIWGVSLPLLVFFSRRKLLVMVVDLVLLGNALGGIQWYALAAVVLLALYNGKRGKLRMKYLFYIYYPAHLAILQLIRMVL